MSVPEADDPVDVLLTECLVAADPAAAIAQALTAHPDKAAELRRRWDFLVAATGPMPGSNAPRDRLGRFHLLVKLGGGGLGIFYRATE